MAKREPLPRLSKRIVAGAVDCACLSASEPRIVRSDFHGAEVETPVFEHFADDDPLIVLNDPQIDILVGEDDDRTIANADDDLAQICGSEGGPSLEISIIRLLAPSVRTRGIDVNDDPLAIAFGGDDHL